MRWESSSSSGKTGQSHRKGLSWLQYIFKSKRAKSFQRRKAARKEGGNIEKKFDRVQIRVSMVWKELGSDRRRDRIELGGGQLEILGRARVGNTKQEGVSG